MLFLREKKVARKEAAFLTRQGRALSAERELNKGPKETGASSVSSVPLCFKGFWF
jgi:hypothetical protein